MSPGLDSERLVELLNKTSDRVACMHHEEYDVLVAQGLDVSQMCAAVETINSAARRGVGIPRTGLAGAAVALRDAQELRRAHDRRASGRRIRT
ncbi:hypothetical protein GCM10010228_02250 [Streptomyces massasporeus]|nr:hypothetical protein GCM10010228_02250 [Streptomyces massasporeus]